MEAGGKLDPSMYEIRLLARHETSINRLVFFGTGTSSCVPNFYCLKERPLVNCKVCETGYRDPFGSGNKRRNTSLFFSFTDGKTEHNYIIDAGKTFYESVLQWWPYYKII